MAAKRRAPKRNPLAGVKKPESYVDQIGGTGRKRRSDASGRKKDYHKDTKTLAVRVPNEMADEVKARAEEMGLSVNAWLVEVIANALDDG